MMNKLRSAKFHLVKFMFVLPLVSVMLLAFRNEWKKQEPRNVQVTAAVVAGNDTIPDKLPPPPPPPPPPAQALNPMKDFLKKNPGVKDVSWAFKDDEEAAIIFVHRKDGKVEEYDIRKESVKSDFISKYGAIPMPPPPPPAPAAPGMGVMVQGYPIAPAAPVDVVTVQGYPIAPAAPVDVVTVKGYPIAPASPQGEVVVTGYATPRPSVRMPENVKSIKITNDQKAEVELKNGKTEKYDLRNPNEKAKFDAKYPAPPPPPPPPAKGMRVEGYPVNVTTGTKIVEGKPLPDNLIYVIDGIITTKYEMGKISPDKIASIDILKGESAVALYGEKAKEGVVQIKLKYDAQPLYVINGEISSREALDKLKPEQIESVDVLKGDKATTAYGDKGKNGVMLIKTKN